MVIIIRFLCMYVCNEKRGRETEGEKGYRGVGLPAVKIG